MFMWVLFFMAAIVLSQNNHNPSFSRGPDINWNQNGGSYTVQWTVGTPRDNDGNTQGLFFTVTANKPELFSRQPTISDQGALDFRPANNAVGAALVTVSLRDDGSASCVDITTCTCNPSNCQLASPSVTFRINIVFVNQRPSFQSIGDVDVAMNSGSSRISNWAFNIIAGPNNDDENIQALTWVVSAPSNPSLFRQAPQILPGGHLTFEAATDQFGDSTVSVTLKDDGGTSNGGQDTSIVMTLRIRVTYVNQKPVFTLGSATIEVDEDSGAGTRSWATGISPGTTLEAATQQVRFITQWVNPSCQDVFLRQPALSPTGVFTWETAKDMDTIQFNCRMYVQAQDNDPSNARVSCDPITACGTVEFIVVPVNDAPFFLAGSNITVWEDLKDQVTPPPVPAEAAYVNWASRISPGNLHEQDAHGQTVRFVVQTDSNAMFRVPPTVDSQGTLRFTLEPYKNGDVVFRVTVYDSEDLQGNTHFVSLTVLSSNNQPTFDWALPIPVRVSQNCQPQTIAVFLSNVVPGPAQATDEFNVQSLTIQASSPSRPELFLDPPRIAFSGKSTAKLTFSCAYNQSGSSNQSVILGDDGGTLRRGVDRTVALFDIIIVPTLFPPDFAIQSRTVEVAQGQCDAGCSFPQFVTYSRSGGVDQSSEVTYTVRASRGSLFAESPAVATSGILTFRSVPRAVGSTVVSMTARSSETGMSSTSELLFNVVIIPVNAAPSFTAGADLSGLHAVSECKEQPAGCLHSYPQWASDIRAGAAGTTNEAEQILQFRAEVPAGAARYFSSSGIQIDARTGTLSFALINNAGNTNLLTFTVTIVLQDNGGTLFGGVDTYRTSFQMEIALVPSPPSGTALPSIATYQDVGTVLVSGFLVGIATGAGVSDTLTASVAVTDESVFRTRPQVFFISPSTGTLTFEMTAGVTGTYAVSVTLTSVRSGLSNTFATNLVVVEVNHAPSFSALSTAIAVDRNSGMQQISWGQSITAGPGREALTQQLSFIVLCDTDIVFSVSPSISAVGVLTFAPSNRIGTATCQVTLKDNGGTYVKPIAGTLLPTAQDESQPITMTITVRAVKTRPSFVASSVVTSYQREGLVAIGAWATNIDVGDPNVALNVSNAAFTVTCAGVDMSTTFIRSPSVTLLGSLIFAFSDAFTGIVHCDVTLRNVDATDSSIATSAVQPVSMVVVGVNTRPSFTLSAVSIVTVYNATAAIQSLHLVSAISGGDAAPTMVFNVTVPTSSQAIFIVQPSISTNSGDLTYGVAANAQGTARSQICLVAMGGTWRENDGSIVNAVTVCSSFTFVVQRSSSPPVILLASTFVTALTNGGVQGSVSDAARTFTFERFAPTIVPGSSLSSSTIVSANALCSGCVSLNGTSYVAPGQLLRTEVRTERAPVTSATTTYSGALVLTVAPFTAGSCSSCHIRIVDSANLATDSETFAIYVLPVNQQPSFRVVSTTVFQARGGSTHSVQWADSISPGSFAEVHQRLHFEITASEPTLSAQFFSMMPTIDSAGRLTFAVANVSVPTSQSLTFAVVLKDDGGVDNGGVDASVAVAVTVNLEKSLRLPVLRGTDITTVAEGSGFTRIPSWITVVSLDIPVAQLTAVVTVNNTQLFAVAPAVVDLVTGAFFFTLAPSGSGVVAVSTVVETAAGNVRLESLLNVTPLSSAPAFQPIRVSLTAGMTYLGPVIRNVTAGRPTGVPQVTIADCRPSNPFNAFNVDASTGLGVLEVRGDVQGQFTCVTIMTAVGGTASVPQVFQILGAWESPAGALAAQSVVISQNATQLSVSFPGRTQANFKSAESGVRLVDFLTNIQSGRNGNRSSSNDIIVSIACSDTAAFLFAPRFIWSSNGAGDVQFQLQPTFFGNLSCNVSMTDAASISTLLSFALLVRFVNLPPGARIVRDYIDLPVGGAVEVGVLDGITAGSALEVVSMNDVVTVRLEFPSELQAYFTVPPQLLVRDTSATLVAVAGFTHARVSARVVLTDRFNASTVVGVVVITIVPTLGSAAVTDHPYITVTLAAAVDVFSQARFADQVAQIMSTFTGNALLASEVEILAVRPGSTVVDFRFERAGATDYAENELIRSFQTAATSTSSALAQILATMQLTTVSVREQTTTVSPVTVAGGENPWWKSEVFAIVVIVVVAVVIIGAVVCVTCLCCRRKRHKKQVNTYVPPQPPTAEVVEWYPVKVQPESGGLTWLDMDGQFNASDRSPPRKPRQLDFGGARRDRYVQPAVYSWQQPTPNSQRPPMLYSR
jgi:Ni,Fe-hydrogenase III small subunit